MKRLLSVFALVALTALLSGCYYEPSYGYVRPTAYAGAAYYGNSTAYGDGYYAAPGWYGYDGWYGGYGYGCCYAPGVVVGGVWYDHWGHRHYGGGGYVRGRGPSPGHVGGGSHGHWSGHTGGNHH
ncbi:hypothetical protein [Rhodanobacter sp. DHG33]|uniref:hypothetical protein n=1 Tax=Rhodanobacter sp. DHG33 TaxID=2775921 RepID=UPI0017866196|nr:hypothetical protein [Rhodanobacter sp. DHG33]MBD8899188.1 hypothetical protein [Rhodanobacter sp. DHG33]